MAFSGKSEQREAAGTNYGSASGTLTSSTVKEPSKMGDNGPQKLAGQITRKSGGNNLSGKQPGSGSPSGLAGQLSGTGFRGGPQWKRAMEPGNLKPGTYAQKNNTTRIDPSDDNEDRAKPRFKVTSSTPKALRGGR